MSAMGARYLRWKMVDGCHRINLSVFRKLELSLKTITEAYQQLFTGFARSLELSGIFKCHFQTSYNVGNLDTVVEMSWNVWNFDTMTCETRMADSVLGYKRWSQLRIAMFGLFSLWLFYSHLSLVIGLLDLLPMPCVSSHLSVALRSHLHHPFLAKLS
jgi:hypothetical protein